MGKQQVAIGLLVLAAVLPGCAIPRSYYEINGTYIDPKNSETVTAKVGGTGLTFGRLVGEFGTNYRLLMGELRGKR